MEKINPNDPAFPVVDPDSKDMSVEIQPGISIRTQLAAMAMQGILASVEGDNFAHPGNIARASVECADALLEELNKQKP